MKATHSPLATQAGALIGVAVQTLGVAEKTMAPIVT